MCVCVLFKYRCAITTGTVTVKQAGPLLTVRLKATEEVLTVDLLITASSAKAALELWVCLARGDAGLSAVPDCLEAAQFWCLKCWWLAVDQVSFAASRFHLQAIPVRVLSSRCCPSFFWGAVDLQRNWSVLAVFNWFLPTWTKINLDFSVPELGKLPFLILDFIFWSSLFQKFSGHRWKKHMLYDMLGYNSILLYKINS